VGRTADDEAFERAWFLEQVNQSARSRLAETQPSRPPTRPSSTSWWPSWIPPTDANGHALGPGAVNFVYVICVGCPATRDDRGHHMVKCREIGCDAPPITPPGHLGPFEEQH
jgi:hypothetical protein